MAGPDPTFAELIVAVGSVPAVTDMRIIKDKNSSQAMRFIDLFAGIGGMRLGFERAGCMCVFSSEWNRYAAATYERNFGSAPDGDITTIPSDQIPNHDILVGGFPCQPFSISGVSKKSSLGRPHGFDDPTQGTLFFEIVRIIREKRPRAFLLENVKNLVHHDKGRTYRVILDTLEDELGYFVPDPQVIDAQAVVPQHRERIYIVGFRDPVPFDFPRIPRRRPDLKDLLEKGVPEKYNLSRKLWNYLQRYAEKHREAGNGFGFGIADPEGITRTLSARYYKDGSEILISRGKGKTPRRLTPRECARLMGFPDSFEIPVSDTQAYKQFGNSVVVPVVEEIARRMVGALASEDKLQPQRRMKQLPLIAASR
jgi:DNA (cytosine-5)-methyltransferase 1